MGYPTHPFLENATIRKDLGRVVIDLRLSLLRDGVY